MYFKVLGEVGVETFTLFLRHLYGSKMEISTMGLSTLVEMHSATSQFRLVEMEKKLKERIKEVLMRERGFWDTVKVQDLLIRCQLAELVTLVKGNDAEGGKGELVGMNQTRMEQNAVADEESDAKVQHDDERNLAALIEPFEDEASVSEEAEQLIIEAADFHTPFKLKCRLYMKAGMLFTVSGCQKESIGDEVNARKTFNQAFRLVENVLKLMKNAGGGGDMRPFAMALHAQTLLHIHLYRKTIAKAVSGECEEFFTRLNQQCGVSLTVKSSLKDLVCFLRRGLENLEAEENEKFAEMSKEDLREREEEEEGRLKECEEKKEQGMKRKKLEEEDRLRQEEAKLKKRSSAQ